MADETSAEIGLVASQQRQMLTEMAAMRDEMVAMMAILQGFDGTVGRLSDAIRGLSGQVHHEFATMS